MGFVMLESGTIRLSRVPRANLRDRKPRAALHVVAVAVIVHVLGINCVSAADVEQATLPPHVNDMRDAMLAAARSGNIDDLKTVFEMSTTHPDLGIGGDNDPIAAMKAASSDGEGREFLAALAEVLGYPPAALPLGKDIENNLVYVWPYLAERSLDSLTGGETVDLYRLITPSKVAEMREKKRWMWWRLVIGADGSWQTLKKYD